MNKNKEKIISISAIVIIIDQIIKILITSKMSINQEIEIVPNFFSILYLKNKGAAFSILQNQKLLLVVISLIVLYILNKYIDKTKIINKLSIISLGFIIGGIIGNLLDRLIQDGVIDYLSFGINNYFFPVFNIADTFIVTGVILLILGMIKEEKKTNPTPVRKKLSPGVEIIKIDNKKSKKNSKKKS